MDVSRNLTSNAVGLCLLPSELIQDIFFRLPLPEIVRLKTVSKGLTSVISSNDFRRDYNIQSSSDSWLFIYKKRSPRDSVLHGFTDRSDRWFKIPVAEFLSPVVPPGEDLYFLTASGDFFLFASNNCRGLIAVNLTLNTVKKIPPSPLGPRGTSSWRRSGLKLIAGPPGSDRFRFLFSELFQNRPVLFEYDSETDTWRSVEAVEIELNQRHDDDDDPGGQRKVYLSVIHRRVESVVLAVGPGNNDAPVILRPRLDGGGIEERLAIGFSMGDVSNKLHVFGDGCMAIVRSEGDKVRMITCIEVWGLSVDGRRWELMSRTPEVLVERVRKPYKVMMGCLEERGGIIRVILVSNIDGLWDLIWLSYDLERKIWKWVPVPDQSSSMKGCNMAGITLSTGLTL